MLNKRFMFIVKIDDRYQIYHNYIESLLTSLDLSIQIVNDHIHRSQIVIVTMFYHLKFIDDDKY